LAFERRCSFKIEATEEEKMEKGVWNGIGVIGVVAVGLVSLLLVCNTPLHLSSGESIPIALRIFIFIACVVFIITIFREIGFYYLYIFSWLIIIGIFFISEVPTARIGEEMQGLREALEIIKAYIQ